MRATRALLPDWNSYSQTVAGMAEPGYPARPLKPNQEDKGE